MANNKERFIPSDPSEQPQKKTSPSTTTELRDLSEVVESKTSVNLSDEFRNDVFLQWLKERFEENPDYYKKLSGLPFPKIREALLSNPTLADTLREMRTDADLEGMFNKTELSSVETDNFLFTLNHRFKIDPKLYERPKGIDFAKVEDALRRNPELLLSLYKMEKTGGSPDIIAVEPDHFVFADCSAEAPLFRRNSTYDEAVIVAKQFGINMMDKETYRKFNKLGNFDNDSWNWLKTPNSFLNKPPVKNAITGQFYPNGEKPVVYHNLADYRYPYCGWRGVLKVSKN